jgi:hypothetical protein
MANYAFSMFGSMRKDDILGIIAESHDILGTTDRAICDPCDGFIAGSKLNSEPLE